MTHQELQSLSRAELIEMVLRQQARLEKLWTILTELEAQRNHFVHVLNGAGVSKKNVGHLAQAILTEQQRVRERATRDALRHLDDAVYLARSSLAELMARTHGVRPEGLELQQALYRAIEALRPVENRSRQPRRQRRYDVLRLTYLEGKRPAEAAQALAISERQYYRDLKAAIQAVADQVLGPQP